MLACAAENGKMIWHKCHFNLTCHILLDAIHHSLHIPAHRIKIHSLMHLLSVPSGNLILPIVLSLCQCVFLKKMMCVEDDKWCCGLKSYASLDADDGVSDVDVTADTERTCNIAYSLDNFHRAHLYAIE